MAPAPPARHVVAETAVARLSNEDDAGALQWLEIDGATGVRVGGYVTPRDHARDALILLLTGASTSKPAGRLQAAWDFYHSYGYQFREVGFCVWTLALSEDMPYGAAEVDEVVAVIDWLDGEGRDFLGVERVYLVGYSTGATVANLVNAQRRVTAVVSLAGLSQPKQLQEQSQLYMQVTGLFPCNTGMSQLRRTITTYAADGWDALDVVARVAEFRSPALLMHAEDDPIYLPENTRAIETAYAALQASRGGPLAPLTFYYVSEGGHFAYVTQPELFDVVHQFVIGFEPED